MYEKLSFTVCMFQYQVKIKLKCFMITKRLKVVA